MGVDSNCYLPGTFIADVNRIIKAIDSQASHNANPVGDSVYFHFIDFNFFGEPRRMRGINYDIDLDRDEKESREKGYPPRDSDSWVIIHELGLPDKTSGIHLTLGASGRSVEILGLLCYIFGGYIRKNDYKESKYTKINKDRRKAVAYILSMQK